MSQEVEGIWACWCLYSLAEAMESTELVYLAAVRVFASTGVDVNSIADYKANVEEAVVDLRALGQEEQAALLMRAYDIILNHNAAASHRPAAHGSAGQLVCQSNTGMP